MARISPMAEVYRQARVALLPYGPGADIPPIELVETFAEVELEYAAIRKTAALFDQPHRAVLEITGADRIGFLNRMLTQELRSFAAGQVRRSFWLNRKGRIDADLRLIELGDRTLVDVDAFAAPRAMSGLSSYIITEDVVIRDLSDQTHRLALHGPAAAAALDAMANGSPAGRLERGQAIAVRLRPSAGTEFECIIDRWDSTGDPGMELIVPIGAVVSTCSELVGTIADFASRPDRTMPAPTATRRENVSKGRPIGWHAYNIARIEAGTPLYNIDFGPDSLPAETGVLDDRVSFTKGCYLGQEIVARMHARGHSKKILTAVRLDVVRDESTGLPLQPVTGVPVLDPAQPAADPIGVVSSSTLAPMLGSAPICFAQLRQDFAKSGMEVMVMAEGRRVRGVVQESLAFWKRPEAKPLAPVTDSPGTP